MARSPKPVRHLLKEKPTLRRIGHELETRSTLLADMRQCLPAELAAHCLSAGLRDGTLVVHTDSPVWATRLRYLAPQLTSVMAHEHPALREIKVKVAIEDNRRPRQHNAANKSDLAAAIIHDNARHTKQASLRNALMRLSRALKSS